MLKATHDQLGEARFFYQHLLTSGSSYSVRHNPREFRYYFSAFIQAARSVLWVAHHEEKEKWKAWEPGWKNRITEPPRVRRRPFGLSHAAMAGCSSMA
jgi:hypothetical protein